MEICIIHGIQSDKIAVRHPECVIVYCPEPELEENWQDNLIEPSLLELHIMDLRATELVTSWA